MMRQEFNVSDSKLITFVTENGVNDCKFFQYGKKGERKPTMFRWIFITWKKFTKVIEVKC